ncbi:hypothetical protein K9L97_02820 [Candidatus Woesearchaeota archaeon]|nr:hypothetical protein [Candidatus Woesearchaeota archaeon]
MMDLENVHEKFESLYLPVLKQEEFSGYLRMHEVVQIYDSLFKKQVSFLHAKSIRAGFLEEPNGTVIDFMLLGNTCPENKYATRCSHSNPISDIGTFFENIEINNLLETIDKLKKLGSDSFKWDLADFVRKTNSLFVPFDNIKDSFIDYAIIQSGPRSLPLISFYVPFISEVKLTLNKKSRGLYEVEFRGQSERTVDNLSYKFSKSLENL